MGKAGADDERERGGPEERAAERREAEEALRAAVALAGSQSRAALVDAALYGHAEPYDGVDAE